MNTDTTKSAVTILLAEDNPGDVFLVRLAIERQGLGADLVIVEDGQAALRYVEEVEAEPEAAVPSLALLDLNLPRANGSQILLRLRQSPKFQAIPIIIVTSSDSPRDRDAAARNGATDYFQKPSDLAGFMELGKLVSEAVRKHRAHRAG